MSSPHYLTDQSMFTSWGALKEQAILFIDIINHWRLFCGMLGGHPENATIHEGPRKGMKLFPPRIICRIILHDLVFLVRFNLFLLNNMVSSLPHIMLAGCQNWGCGRVRPHKDIRAAGTNRSSTTWIYLLCLLHSQIF